LSALTMMLHGQEGETRCPLCGGENHCALAHGESRCWCFDERIPGPLLAQIPPAVRNRSCVCFGCIRAQLPSEPERGGRR
jgi:cysteine-rich CWC protein